MLPTIMNVMINDPPKTGTVRNAKKSDPRNTNTVSVEDGHVSVWELSSLVGALAAVILAVVAFHYASASLLGGAMLAGAMSFAVNLFSGLHH